MTLHDYRASQLLGYQEVPLAALVMAAMNEAYKHDPLALEHLASGWPELYVEWRDRRSLPLGLYPDEQRSFA